MILQAFLAKYALKGGIVLTFLSIIFYAGCSQQRRIDAGKIQKLIDRNKEYVEIIEVFQDNYDVVTQAVKDQNAAITKLGEKSIRKMESLESSHYAAITRLNAANNDTIRAARDEAAELRERMAGLSTAEACHTAMMEIAHD